MSAFTSFHIQNWADDITEIFFDHFQDCCVLNVESTFKIVVQPNGFWVFFVVVVVLYSNFCFFLCFVVSSRQRCFWSSSNLFSPPPPLFTHLNAIKWTDRIETTMRFNVLPSWRTWQTLAGWAWKKHVRSEWVYSTHSANNKYKNIFMEWTVDSGHWRVHFNFFAFYVMESYFGLFGKFPFDRAFRWPSSSSLLVVVISHAMAIFVTWPVCMTLGEQA